MAIERYLPRNRYDWARIALSGLFIAPASVSLGMAGIDLMAGQAEGMAQSAGCVSTYDCSQPAASPGEKDDVWIALQSVFVITIGAAGIKAANVCQRRAFDGEEPADAATVDWKQFDTEYQLLVMEYNDDLPPDNGSQKA